MYVTRRLLRSTMPPEPVLATPEKEDKHDVPFLPPPTPKRRAAVRASAKICEVVADASGPAARSRAAKLSENGGDEKNKSRSQKKTKKDKKKEEESELDTSAALEVAKLHGYQLMVDVHYRGEQYTEARVLDLDPVKEVLFVHYMGWNARFDAWVPVEELAAHGSHTGVDKKKDVSWDGETSLFATEEEVAAAKVGGKVKPRKTLKKRTALSPKARQAARKALRSASSDRKRHIETATETEDAQPVAKHSVRKSPKNAKAAKKHTAKSPLSGKKVSAKRVPSPARRTPRRVQVAVGTTDEDSELKNDTETADLVLDVEIEGHEASNDEDVQEEEGEQEEVLSSRGKKRTNSKSKSRRKVDNESPGFKRKRNTNPVDDEVSSTTSGAQRSPANNKKTKTGGAGNAAAKTAPLPPSSGHGGLGSAAREKLQAIFRLRVQQKQQMEQLDASQASFQQSLQDQPTAESTEAEANTANATGATDDETTNTAMANPELAAAEEYQRQLQQYYYHQQVMLANSLPMNIAGTEDPSTAPLQGGVMDPRIIQERLAALEERRRQQAHVQAYYHQLMLTRERNVRALAANQAFMTQSAAVWEQQLKETQSEDGNSSVTSWKDITGADSSETDKASPKGESTAAEAGSDVGDSNSSKGDNESTKESETSAAAVVSASSDEAQATSPTTIDKAESSPASADTSPSKSVSSKDDPADPPTQGVLYEYVL